MATSTFNQRLLAWFDQYGRTNLPWQKNPTPYRVWIAEIMLQQTQVNTVIPYYQRFMARFPDVATLAAASLDEVLYYWSGLGYYARARHLHQTAQQIGHQYHGELPTNFEQLIQLPGIGRSTAGAILALAYKQRYPILDGNVKRVLCRYYALTGHPHDKRVADTLWHLAEKNTPTQRVAAYTQAIMDLGATVCVRHRPHCLLCPFEPDCLAHQHQREVFYPSSPLRKTLPVKTTTFIMLQNDSGEVLLEKRPPKGIWGGLWSFPECALPDDVPHWCQQHLQLVVFQYHLWQPLRHTFTHFHLDIIPVHIPILIKHDQLVVFSNRFWYNTVQPPIYGLAVPVARLLAQLTSTGELSL
jgi:A/G-specific adenine glycosylase